MRPVCLLSRPTCGPYRRPTMSPRSLCDGQSAHPCPPRADAVEVVAKPALVAIKVGHGLCTIPISVTTTHSQQSLGAAYLRRTRTSNRNRRLSRTQPAKSMAAGIEIRIDVLTPRPGMPVFPPPGCQIYGRRNREPHRRANSPSRMRHVV
jgi:hypothetical protein